MGIFNIGRREQRQNTQKKEKSVHLHYPAVGVPAHNTWRKLSYAFGLSIFPISNAICRLLTFEDSSWVGCVHGQKNTGGLSIHNKKRVLMALNSEWGFVAFHYSD